MKQLFILFFVIFLGCSNSHSGPLSVNETSDILPKIDDRINFIENYVTFKRTYEKLEYDIAYQNNGGGMLPGPSDWDIKLLAVVPTEEISDWIPDNAKMSKAQPPKWLGEIPGDIPVSGLTEWYRNGSSEIGIDRASSTIAYRSTTMPD